MTNFPDIQHNLVDMTNIGRLISSGALTGEAELPKVIFNPPFRSEAARVLLQYFNFVSQPDK